MENKTSSKQKQKSIKKKGKIRKTKKDASKSTTACKSGAVETNRKEEEREVGTVKRSKVRVKSAKGMRNIGVGECREEEANREEERVHIREDKQKQKIESK